MSRSTRPDRGYGGRDAWPGVHGQTQASHDRTARSFDVRVPDAPDVLGARHDELLDALSWTDTAVIELYRTRVRHHPPQWE